MNKDKDRTYSAIQKEVGDLIGEREDVPALMMDICELLAERIDYYDWVGFYLIDPENPGDLILGPYVGEHTDHTRIGFGKGICGQAVEREEAIIVPDVREQENYLSCNIHVRSEIVVLIRKEGVIVGEIDIDSHTLDSFAQDDQVLLEGIAELIGPRM